MRHVASLDLITRRFYLQCCLVCLVRVICVLYHSSLCTVGPFPDVLVQAFDALNGRTVFNV